ncbi:MAG: 1-acyl-sn-glycerol-3-phosphate acyltransferase [Bacteroidetes bacterium]|nr:1-acyl-sn-glycerol-3-phosphate acyltransferase [Bacteroidota bacterium]
MKLGFRLWFRRITCCGMEQIDNGGATIILANHTASFMDAMLVACFVRRKVHFFTRGDVFGNPYANRLMRHLGMLPIYRMVDGKDMLQHNESSNSEAAAILKGGGAVLIFCEGISDVAPVLKPLKKGPFRLAASLIAEQDMAIALIPLGINYIDPEHPYEDVFLEAGRAIDLSKEGSSLPHLATRAMRRAELDLAPLVWNVPEQAKWPLVGIGLKSFKQIVARVRFSECQNFLAQVNSEAWDTSRLLQSYNRIRDQEKVLLEIPTKGKKRQMHQLIVLLGLPIGFLGVVLSGLPLYLAKTIADQRVSSPDFRAPVQLSLAVLLSLCWYLLVIFGLLTILPLMAVVFTVLVGGWLAWFWLKIYLPEWILFWKHHKAGTANLPVELKDFHAELQASLEKALERN